MNHTTLFAIVMLILPLAVAATACSNKAEHPRSHITVAFADEDSRGWLGVSIDDVTSRLAHNKSLKTEEGAYVRDVEEQSPAEKAGITEGDVIVNFDGKKIRDSEDLVDAVRDSKPGTEVAITIERNKEAKTLRATIGEEPRRFSVVPRIPRIPHFRIEPHINVLRLSTVAGMTLEKLKRQLAEYFGAPDGKGILVKNVREQSEAEKAGFKAGDVIIAIGKEKVEDVHDIWSALKGYKDGEKAAVHVLRNGDTQVLTLTVPGRDDTFGWGNGDVLIDLQSNTDLEQLRHELEDMRRNLRENMHGLREKIERESWRVRHHATI